MKIKIHNQLIILLSPWKRSVFTGFGWVDFERTYYEDKKNQGYIHPVDKVVGLESYERVSLSIASELVNHSVEASYGQSSRHVTKDNITRQTVMNKVRKAHSLEVKGIQKKKRKVKILHIIKQMKIMYLCKMEVILLSLW